MPNTKLDDTMNVVNTDGLEDDTTADVVESGNTEAESDIKCDTSTEADIETSKDDKEAELDDTPDDNDVDDATDSDPSVDTNLADTAHESEYPKLIELNRPVNVYRGCNVNSFLGKTSGTICIKGPAKDGYVPVSCGMNGIGTVSGYIASANIGKVN